MYHGTQLATSCRLPAKVANDAPACRRLPSAPNQREMSSRRVSQETPTISLRHTNAYSSMASLASTAWRTIDVAARPTRAWSESISVGVT